MARPFDARVFDLNAFDVPAAKIIPTLGGWVTLPKGHATWPPYIPRSKA